MPFSAIYVAGSTASLLLDYLDRAGLHLPELRARLMALKDEPRMPITTWWALLDELQRAHPIPNLGLAIGACLQPHHIGVLGYLAIFSDSLWQALSRFSRFQPLLHNMTPTEVRLEGEDLVMWWDPQPGHSPWLSDEVLAAGFITLIRSHSSRADARPNRVEFPHPPPADVTPYEAFFQCPVVFNCAALVIRLPIKDMNARPTSANDPHLTGVLEQQAEAMLKTLPTKDTLLNQLRHHIAMCLQDGTPEFGVVAQRMGMAERTLYRSLNERGLRYKLVLNDLRFQLAKSYLQDNKLSLPDIALLLGFAEQSAFSRAFKGWSGETPMQYRRARWRDTHR